MTSSMESLARVRFASSGESSLSSHPHAPAHGMSLTQDTSAQPEESFDGEVEPSDIRKIPTGIADLDTIVDGGFPAGSTVLLMGEEGAGPRARGRTSGRQAR